MAALYILSKYIAAAWGRACLDLHATINNLYAVLFYLADNRIFFG